MRIKIEKLINGGSGLGEFEGRKIFVPYSAPGDLLDVEVTMDHGVFAEAAIVSIVEPSPCRVQPPCSAFGRCGGCQWQHISYETQIEWKKKILTETLERIGKIESPNVLDTLASPKQWNYRNRIQLHVDSKGRIGFYKPKSKEVVEFEKCAIADERINEQLAKRRDEISKRDRGIALRVKDEIEGSFSQINSEQNDRLKKILNEWLAEVPHTTILELYAGSGNFTFAIAKDVGRVVASDIDAKAIEAAWARQIKENAFNVEFMCASAPRAARRLKGECDAVLIDPPRKGCAEAIGAIVDVHPKTIIYISCDPATLARDALAFAEHGFKLQKTLPVDMFPQTFHIESMSMFVR